VNRRSTGFVCCVMLVLAIACGSREKAETGQSDALESPSQTEIVAGFAVYGHEVRSFRPCGDEQPLWAIDRSGVLWEIYEDLAFHNEPYEEVFGIVEGHFGPAPETGFGADYTGTIEVKKLLYMAQEGFRCNLDLTEFHYRVFGNEPFWTIWISAGEIVLKMPGRDDKTWTDIRERPLDAGVVYTAAGHAGPIEIRIVDEPCRDSMSGAYFGLSATVGAGDLELRGCVLRGAGTQ
jgi:uncharacterized membrane protein